MENKENCESRLQTLLTKDWFSEQPGNIIIKKVCVINDKTLERMRTAVRDFIRHTALCRMYGIVAYVRHRGVRTVLLHRTTRPSVMNIKWPVEVRMRSTPLCVM